MKIYESQTDTKGRELSVDEMVNLLSVAITKIFCLESLKNMTIDYLLTYPNDVLRRFTEDESSSLNHENFAHAISLAVTNHVPSEVIY